MAHEMTHVPTWLERYQANPHKHTTPYHYWQEENKELRERIAELELALYIYLNPHEYGKFIK